MHLTGAQSLGRGTGELLHAVPDRDAVDSGSTQDTIHLLRRHEVKQGVGGGVVADGPGEVKGTLPAPPRGMTEAPEPLRPAAGELTGRDVDQGAAVESPFADPGEYRDGERELHQRRDGKLGLRIDADLFSALQVPDQDRPVRAAVGEPVPELADHSSVTHGRL